MSENPPVPMTIRSIAPPVPKPSPTTTIKSPVETLRHKKAFEYYYSLGDERTLTQVGKEFKVSSATITKWSGRYDWVERVITRDNAIGERLKYETDAETTETRRNILKIIRTLVKNMITEDDKGNFAIQGIKLKNIAEMREAYELSEKILNPNASGDGNGEGKQQIQVNITK